MKNISYSLIISLSLLIIVSCSTESTPVYQLTTSSSPTDAGIVNPPVAEYEEGEEVQVTASPNEHWIFDSWLGGHTGNTNPATVTMNRDKDITALFIKREYPLTVETKGEGTVSERVVQAKTTDYPHGTTVELTANPADGWEFVEWQGDLTGNENPLTIQIENETSVTALFHLSADSDPYISLAVNWDDMDSVISNNKSAKFLSSETSGQITHFGTRLVYVQENAVYMQSAKKSGDEQAFITLKVPPTEEAFLLVAAVHYDGINEALLFGTMDNISLQKGVEYDWSTENIEWTVPSWTVVDSLSEDYENGVLKTDKDKESFELTLHVTEPFHPFLKRLSNNPSYEESIIKINGTGVMADYDPETGLRDFRFIFDNPSVGTANAKFYGNSFPRVDSQMFNLPSAGYIVDKKIEVEISWE